jgi:hypothetical protein
MEKPTIIEQLNHTTQSYFQRIGLSTIKHNSEVEKYLELSREDMSKLSANECVEIAHMLTRESLYLQQQINQNNSKIFWINAKIDATVAPRLNNYDKYMPHQSKKLCAIKDDDVLESLYKNLIQCQTQNELLAYLPTYIKNLSDTLIELSKIKRNKKE